MSENSKIVKRILIVKPSSLGDVLHVFPAMELIRNCCPEAKIDWLIHPAFADLLQFTPPIDRVILFKRRELGRLSSLPGTLFKLIRELRKEQYDLIFDFQGLLRSALFARIAGGAVVGFKDPKEQAAALFYKWRGAARKPAEHAVDRNLRLVEEFFRQRLPQKTSPLQNNECFAAEAKKLLQTIPLGDNDKVIALIPGARWESKCWPPEFFAKLARALTKREPELKFICIGSGADTAAAGEIIKLSKTGNIFSLTGQTTVGGMVELLRRCDAVVTNDSGPMHVAAALNKPTFALFGATDPVLTGPYSDNGTVYVPENLSCVKCLKRICPHGNLKCHQAIDYHKVADDIMLKLSGDL